jgi:peptidoglycan/LPS O-acetylase OafA/YrhL
MQVFYDFERTNPVGNFLSDYGSWGVDVFFVISGFIMTFIVSTKERTVGTFALNRFIRIIPNYWFYTGLALIFGMIIPYHTSSATFSSVFQSLLFIPHENPSDLLGMFPILSVGWTLNYEMLFYALVAIALLFGNKPLPLRFMVVVLMLCSMPILDRVLNLGVYYKYHLIEFAFGVFLYYLFTGYWWRFRFWVLILALVATLVEFHPILERLIVSFLIVLLALILEKYIGAKSVFSKVGLFFGNISFSVYLSHILVLNFIAYSISGLLSDDLSGIWVFYILIMTFSLVLILSYLSYLFIEVKLARSIKKRVFY